MLVNINPNNPQPRLIRRVSEALQDGATIAYPTDTYYGIGCDIMNKKGIGKIYRIKRRSQKKPFSFICADLKNISQYAKVSNYAYKTMKRLLPGPYTFVLEGAKLVPKIVLTAQKTAGIRVPNHPNSAAPLYLQAPALQTVRYFPHLRFSTLLGVKLTLSLTVGRYQDSPQAWFLLLGISLKSSG